LISLSDLPGINCVLNLTSALCLVAGFACIRWRSVRLHAAAMLAAFSASTLFLASYVTYHYMRQWKYEQAHTPYSGEGVMKAIYYAVLLSHAVLAVVVVPLVLRTLYLALRRRWTAHRRWARWTFPLWLYVSVTGVVVYFMLYGLGSSGP
jgi:putative membrane protein